jgi:hypothetical protein
MQLSVAFSAYCEGDITNFKVKHTRYSEVHEDDGALLRHHRQKRHEHEAVHDSGLDSLFIQLLNFAADKKALQSRNRQLVMFQNARDLQVSLSANLNPYFSDLWQ